MRGDDTGAFALVACHGLLHNGFAGLIQGAGGFVEDQQGGIDVERPGYGDALYLSAGKAGAARIDGAVNVRAVRPQKVDGRFTAGPADALRVRWLPPIAEGHVLSHCAGKEVGGLGNVADLFAVGGQSGGGHGPAVHQQSSARGLQQPAQDVDEGAFARARAPHQPQGRAQRDAAVDVREGVALSAGIAVGDVLKDDFFADAEIGRGPRHCLGRGGAEPLKIVQAGQGRGLQAANAHCRAHHPVERGQNTPGCQGQQGDGGGDHGQRRVLDVDQQKNRQPNQEKTRAFQCPCGNTGADAEKGARLHAGVDISLDSVQKGGLLLVDDQLAHAADGGDGRGVFLLLGTGRARGGLVYAAAQQAVNAPGYGQHEGHGAERDARRIDGQAREKQGHSNKIAVGGEKLQKHLSQIKTPLHAGQGLAALRGKMPAVGHVQKALHNICAHMGCYRFPQHGRAPGHQRGKEVFAHDKGDGQQAGPHDQATVVREDWGETGKPGQKFLRVRRRGELRGHVQDGEESCQRHNACQFRQPQ